MKYELLEFKNGKYGIRRRSFIQNLFNFGGIFFDFDSSSEYYWGLNSKHFKDCETSSLVKAEEIYQRLTGTNIFRKIK
jgi:hypothetical protein